MIRINDEMIFNSNNAINFILNIDLSIKYNKPKKNNAKNKSYIIIKKQSKLTIARFKISKRSKTHKLTNAIDIKISSNQLSSIQS